MLKITNILLVGVGGQGIVSSSDIISDIALSRDHDVKKSEIHGMSQRGGVVYSFVRFGEKVHSPLPFREEVNFIVSFEELEILRWAQYANPATKVIVNTQRIHPVSSGNTKFEYPDVKSLFTCKKVAYIDAIAIAKELGDIKFVNSVMTGALCACLDFNENDFRNAFAKRVGKLVDENSAAFLKGKERMQ